MTALFMILLVAAFVVVDVVVRMVGKKMEASRAQRERHAVLTSALQLSFADEAKSLKRAELPKPRARILAVDDEPVILDSFRKILVLAGFSVDTVENGPEALTLLRARDYDFLFTDLKMPEMDGVEVVKAAKHLRPDMDVVVITGYGTIETAVETMQFGAVDYVQKPFTEDELVAMTQRLQIKREARLEAHRKPTVRVVAPSVAEIVASGEYCVPGGAFVYPGHTWARIDPDGQVWTGLDDFARKVLKSVERVELPAAGTKVKRGDPLFTLRKGAETVRFRSPLTGEVTRVNELLRSQPQLLLQSPYDRGWACLVRPSELGTELDGLRIGQPVVAWYQDEVLRMHRELDESGAEEWKWADLETRFFGPGLAVNAPVTETVSAG
jgi:CheY-like chemotaxis protein/glycine cleavage system H lipoate-binding protein